jgi:FtsP/CotA-like multicopper oxidase with cupredoxin domain
LLIVVVACSPPPGVTRTYFVAADEVEWDYLPLGVNALTEQPIDGEFYRVRGLEDTVIATVFTKAVYRAYTDSTFTELAPRPPEWQHLGMLGPTMRAAVGDTIVVVFRNNTRHAVSVHPHGVIYDKDSEGAPYADGTELKHDDGVPPGEVHRYVWPVPERAGPGPADPSSIIWPYHSHTEEVKDVNGGLIGAMIVTARGMADAEGRPTDVDREFVTLFGAFLENVTHYDPENRARYVGDTLRVGPNGPRFFNGNGYHTINGLMYGNVPLPSLSMDEGDRVRWYVFASTSFNDFHTPHWHGGTLLINEKRADVADLGGPLLMLTADMVADNPGIWLFHCHFGEHMEEGMSARFEIRPSSGGGR